MRSAREWVRDMVVGGTTAGLVVGLVVGVLATGMGIGALMAGQAPDPEGDMLSVVDAVAKQPAAANAETSPRPD